VPGADYFRNNLDLARWLFPMETVTTTVTSATPS
jgi:hypothetical protein